MTPLHIPARPLELARPGLRVAGGAGGGGPAELPTANLLLGYNPDSLAQTDGQAVASWPAEAAAAVQSDMEPGAQPTVQEGELAGAKKCVRFNTANGYLWSGGGIAQLVGLSQVDIYVAYRMWDASFRRTFLALGDIENNSNWSFMHDDATNFLAQGGVGGGSFGISQATSAGWHIGQLRYTEDSGARIAQDDGAWSAYSGTIPNPWSAAPYLIFGARSLTGDNYSRVDFGEVYIYSVNQPDETRADILAYMNRDGDFF